MFFFINNFYRLNNIFKELFIAEGFSGRNEDNLFDRNATDLNGIFKELITQLKKKVDLNSYDLSLNKIMKSEIPFYIINPVYKFLSDRNLKIFYQLLINPDIINEATFKINSSTRIELEKKIEKLIQDGYKLKSSFDYKTNGHVQFVITIDGEDFLYENEAQYVSELLYSLFTTKTHIYSFEKISLSKKGYYQFMNNVKRVNVARHNIDKKSISNEKLPIVSPIKDYKTKQDINNIFLGQLMTRKFISVYEKNFNDFHVEFRMFSLDKFFEDNKSKEEYEFAKNMRKTIEGFVEKTENYMVNVLQLLDKNYSIKNSEQFKSSFLFNLKNKKDINSCFNKLTQTKANF